MQYLNAYLPSALATLASASGSPQRRGVASYHALVVYYNLAQKSNPRTASEAGQTAKKHPNQESASSTECEKRVYSPAKNFWDGPLVPKYS